MLTGFSHPKAVTSGCLAPALASWVPSLLSGLGCIAIGCSASWLTMAGMSGMCGAGAAAQAGKHGEKAHHVRPVRRDGP